METVNFSLDFDFSTNTGEKGTSSNFADNLTDMSVSFWIKSTNTGAGPFAILSKGPSYAANNSWEVDLTSGTIQWLQTNNSGANNFNGSNTAPSDGNWHNVVCTKATNTLSIYIDGILNQPTVHQITLGSYSNSNNVVLASWDSTVQELQGRVADVAIWNVALSSSDASNIAAGGDLPTSGLLAHWPFPEGSGLTTADTSGNGETMTLIQNVNDMWSTDVPPPLQHSFTPKQSSAFLVF